jgi:hypothetical protein
MIVFQQMKAILFRVHRLKRLEIVYLLMNDGARGSVLG